jgi:hypothetical protein
MEMARTLRKGGAVHGSPRWTTAVIWALATCTPWTGLAESTIEVVPAKPKARSEPPAREEDESAPESKPEPKPKAQSKPKPVPEAEPGPKAAPEPAPAAEPESSAGSDPPSQTPARSTLPPAPKATAPPPPGVRPGAAPDRPKVRPWPYITLAASSVAIVAGSVLLADAASTVSDADNFEIEVEPDGDVEVTDRFVDAQRSVVINGLSGTLLLSTGIAGALTSVLLITR